MICVLVLGINEFRRQPAIYIQPVFPHFHIVSGKKLNTSIVSLSKMAKSIKKKIFFRAARTFQGTFSFFRLPNQILLLLLHLTPKADSIKSRNLSPSPMFICNQRIRNDSRTFLFVQFLFTKFRLRSKMYRNKMTEAIVVL